jgi:hypothetical protein
MEQIQFLDISLSIQTILLIHIGLTIFLVAFMKDRYKSHLTIILSCILAYVIYSDSLNLYKISVIISALLFGVEKLIINKNIDDVWKLPYYAIILYSLLALNTLNP